MSDSILYSQIPPAELPTWSDDDLSGAMFDEAVERAGGYDYTNAAVAGLPLGFRTVLAEGRVRGHAENDGLVTAIWNDDGVELFAILRDCLAELNLADAAAAAYLRDLTRVVDAVTAWQNEAPTPRTPREPGDQPFEDTDLGQQLESWTDDFCDHANAAFPPIIAHLRANPRLFR